jgi:hypothetical protein
VGGEMAEQDGGDGVRRDRYGRGIDDVSWDCAIRHRSREGFVIKRGGARAEGGGWGREDHERGAVESCRGEQGPGLELDGAECREGLGIVWAERERPQEQLLRCVECLGWARLV